MGPGVIRKYERELQPLEGIGLTDVEMDASLAVDLGHAHGVASRSLSAARAKRETGLDDQAWWGAVGPVLAQVIQEPLPVSGRVGTNASTH